MNKKRLKSYQSTGVTIGFIIDFILILIIGVNSNKINNYIYLGICSLVPTLLTMLMINIELYKYNRITKNRFIISIIISITISFIIGFLIELFIINVLNIKVWNIERLLLACLKSLIGVTIGIISHLTISVKSK